MARVYSGLGFQGEETKGNDGDVQNRACTVTVLCSHVVRSLLRHGGRSCRSDVRRRDGSGPCSWWEWARERAAPRWIGALQLVGMGEGASGAEMDRGPAAGVNADMVQ